MFSSVTADDLTRQLQTILQDEFICDVHIKPNNTLAALAIELDGHEHEDDARTKIRDQKKQACCDKAGLKLIRIENCYARRYNTIKQILLKSFGGKK